MMYALVTLILLGTPNIHELIAAKRWDEAEGTLASLSVQVRPRFEGLIAQGRGASAKAAEAFERALTITPGIPQLHLHAAHAYFKLAQFKDVLRHARAASEMRAQAVAQPLLEARALEGLGRDGEAYSVLHRACDTYTKEFQPCLELAALAHRKRLRQEVRRASRKTLDLGPSRTAVMALFHLLYGDREAVPMLEEIVAQYPGDAELRGLLGHVYAGNRRWFSAARLFEEASTLGGHYAFEAADQYRMAGRYRHALRMNSQASSNADQQAQRLSILFEDRQYARIVLMQTTFSKPDARYRVAYAHYAVGDYDGAEQHARPLLDSNYGQEATALLKAIEIEHAR